MSDATPQPSLEERKLALEERKAKQVDRQQALDNRWVKVWGPTLITAILALTGVLCTVAVTYEENQVSDQEKSLEGARAAAAIYFDKLGDLETNDNLTAAESDRLQNDLSIITTLSDDKAFTDIVDREKKRITAAGVKNSLPNEISSSLSQIAKGQLEYFADSALSGLPSLVATPSPGHQYEPDQFLAFPQVPGPSGVDSYATSFVQSLITQGFKVQPTEYMASGKSPTANQIRYYHADQKSFAAGVASTLKTATGLTFNPVQLRGSALPNGVMEFWLGTDSLPAPHK